MVWAIEGYELLAEVGQGQTGLVVSARDAATGATVAIRYLTQDVFASPGFIVRYRGEVAMLGLIEHPNVANIYELVELGDEAAAVVTEQVEGVSLREILTSTGPLEPQAALYVVQSALLGLAEVHGNSIVHRVIKPENLLIDAAGTVKVLDIGLPPPSYNRLPSNPVYAAPELWSGAEPTPTSDVYATTVVLFECLAGYPPQGAGGGYLGQSAQAADDAIAAIRSGLAPHQIRVYMAHGLAADPMARLGDARTALEQLNVVAHLALGPNWYDNGHAMVQHRAATLLAARPPAYHHAVEAPAYPPPPPGPNHGAPPDAMVPSDADAMTMTGAVMASRLPFRAPSWTDNEPAPWLADPPGREPQPVREPEPTSRPAQRAPRSAEAEPEPERPAWEAERRSWMVPEGQSHRKKSNVMSRAVTIIGVLVMLAAGTAFALTSAFGRGNASPDPDVTDTPSTPGPTVPAPGSGNDTVKPTQPADLKVTGRSISGVTLAWAGSTDNINVAGYIVVRNGARVGTTLEAGYTDAGLESETKYEYAVAAFDDAGNVSAASPSVEATTLKEPDVSPPTAPAGLGAVAKSIKAREITLKWSPSTDNIGVAGYRIFRGTAQIATVPSTQLTFRNTGLAPDTQYEYRVRAFDTSQNVSANSNTFRTRTAKATSNPPPTTAPPPTTTQPPPTTQPPTTTTEPPPTTTEPVEPTEPSTITFGVLVALGMASRRRRRNELVTCLP